MSLVNCHECGREVYDKAPTCPHCGVLRGYGKSEPSKFVKIGGSFIALVLAIGIIAKCSEDPKPEKNSPIPAATPEPVAKQVNKVDQPLKPEMVVTFKDGNLICATREGLEEFMSHALKGEKTKANSMTVENGGGCTMIPPGKKVRLISVEYNNSDSDIALLEMVGAEVKTATEGAWGLSVGAQIVK